MKAEINKEHIVEIDIAQKIKIRNMSQGKYYFLDSVNILSWNGKTRAKVKSRERYQFAKGTLDAYQSTVAKSGLRSGILRLKIKRTSKEKTEMSILDVLKEYSKIIDDAELDLEAQFKPYYLKMEIEKIHKIKINPNTEIRKMKEGNTTYYYIDVLEFMTPYTDNDGVKVEPLGNEIYQFAKGTLIPLRKRMQQNRNKKSITLDIKRLSQRITRIKVIESEMW